MSERRVSRWFQRRYGAGPLHLAAHLLALGLVAFAGDRIFANGSIRDLLLLYVGIAIAHDLVFLPAYVGLDRLLGGILGRQRHRRAQVPLINHLRAPALISGVLLLIYAPLILGRGDAAHLALTGQHLGGYLASWLLITAALFGVSLIIYALRLARAAVRRRAAA